MTRADIFAPDFTTDPYWWREARPRDLPERPLPARADVAIVGAGGTGLAVALPLARAGRSVVILEAALPGEGASTRSGGNVSRTLKATFPELVHHHGEERAVDYYREAGLAIEHLSRLIEEEGIECGYRRQGRYYAAHNPRAYETLESSSETLRRRVGYEVEMIPRAAQREHIGSDRYHGLQLVKGPAILHGATFYAGMLDRTLAAGAEIHARTRVTGIRREGDGFEVETSRGGLRAAEVVVATNAETGADNPLFSWLRRRILPIRAFVCATEAVDAERMARIIPGGRTVITTHKIVYHIQPSPDRRHLLFGGRAGRNHASVPAVAAALHGHFAERFPDFRDLRIAHAWEGHFAYTFDALPRFGQRDGVHFILGDCGTGIPLFAWLGHKTALRILGRMEEARTALDDLPCPTMVGYTGNPWFVPAAVRWYALRDALPF
ncbi:MAG: FAD-binding oxidoreductase [Rhodospirillaceae bacterium]|nr:FAD-binding oxidoreductase [Rhodospirillaceae bacterium]MBT6118750.1 FAD-binding oxidoreductase [Rhodospirillaceae bacterium]